MQLRLFFVALALVISAIPAARAQSLIKDGSFENPVTPPGTHVTYSLGQNIGPWAVVGPAGSNVDLISRTYTEAGFSFPAKRGMASADLTGAPDDGLAQGLAQTVKTVSGGTYELTFFVGNIYDPSGYFGTTSTVNVYVGQTLLISATNEGGDGKPRMVWKEFSANFVASGTTTTLSFINGDLAGSGDRICGLDAVVLTSVGTPGR
jgi:hypothetical protein